MPVQSPMKIILLWIQVRIKVVNLLEKHPKEVTPAWLKEHLQCTGNSIRHTGGPHASIARRSPGKT